MSFKEGSGNLPLLRRAKKGESAFLAPRGERLGIGRNERHEENSLDPRPLFRTGWRNKKTNFYKAQGGKGKKGEGKPGA